MTPLNTDRAEIVTRKHIARVQQLLHMIVVEILCRSDVHDQSKLNPVELVPLQKMQEINDRQGPAKFGTPEYEERRSVLDEMLEHHYSHNSHHPEHFNNGVNGMSLIDVLEMLVDWKAASERDGNDILRLGAAVDRFEIGPQLAEILHNTAVAFGFKPDVDLMTIREKKSVEFKAGFSEGMRAAEHAHLSRGVGGLDPSVKALMGHG